MPVIAISTRSEMDGSRASYTSCAPRFSETPFKAEMIRRRVTMTTETTEQAGVTTEQAGVGLGRGGRLSRQRKRDAGLRLLRGEDLETLSRALGAPAATLTEWQDTFVAAGEASLAARSTTSDALESERLKAKLGAMLLERELLEARIAALEAKRPLARRRSRPPCRPPRPQAAGPMAWPACAGSGAPHGPVSIGISPPLGPNRPGVPARLGRCRMRRWWTRSARF